MFHHGNHRCFLVALEGADRMGKSTQAKMLEERLAPNFKSIDAKIPYNDGATHDLIYEMLKTGQAVEHPVVFQTLQGCNRRIFQMQYLPTLARHFEVVVLDRWTTSTWVYGRASGVADATTAAIVQGLAEPDLVAVLDGDPFPSLHTLDAYEQDSAFQGDVRARYRKWVTENPSKAVLVNANQPAIMVCRTLIAHICRVLIPAELPSH